MMPFKLLRFIYVFCSFYFSHKKIVHKTKFHVLKLDYVCLCILSMGYKAENSMSCKSHNNLKNSNKILSTRSSFKKKKIKYIINIIILHFKYIYNMEGLNAPYFTKWYFYCTESKGKNIRTAF